MQFALALGVMSRLYRGGGLTYGANWSAQTFTYCLAPRHGYCYEMAFARFCVSVALLDIRFRGSL